MKLAARLPGLSTRADAAKLTVPQLKAQLVEGGWDNSELKAYLLKRLQLVLGESVGQSVARLILQSLTATAPGNGFGSRHPNQLVGAKLRNKLRHRLEGTVVQLMVLHVSLKDQLLRGQAALEHALLRVELDLVQRGGGGGYGRVAQPQHAHVAQGGLVVGVVDEVARDGQRVLEVLDAVRRASRHEEQVAGAQLLPAKAPRYRSRSRCGLYTLESGCTSPS